MFQRNNIRPVAVRVLAGGAAAMLLVEAAKGLPNPAICVVAIFVFVLAFLAWLDSEAI